MAGLKSTVYESLAITSSRHQVETDLVSIISNCVDASKRSLSLQPR